MSTLAPNYPEEGRKSTETDHRHLLADSVAPSESASMIDYDGEGERTPRAQSPRRAASQISRRSASTLAPTSYRGFPSEADYLAALKEWAESKKYLEPETMLVGFYGQRTMEDYASQPRPELGLKKKWKARKDKKAAKENGRRNTVA